MARKGAFDATQTGSSKGMQGRGKVFNAVADARYERSGKGKPTETVKNTGMPGPFANPLIKPMNITAAPTRKISK